MSLDLISPPMAEPVTLAELKEHLKIDGAAEDAVIAGLGVAARQLIEARYRVALLPQIWRFALDCAAEAPIVIPLSPVASIDAVGVTRSGVTETLSPISYEAQAGNVGRVRLKSAVAGGDGFDRVVISFTAGWPDAASVPDALKLAIKIVAAHYYENREGEPTGPAALGAILAPYRQVRL